MNYHLFCFFYGMLFPTFWGLLKHNLPESPPLVTGTLFAYGFLYILTGFLFCILVFNKFDQDVSLLFAFWALFFSFIFIGYFCFTDPTFYSEKN
jgi:hypothetical protein